MKNTHWLKYAHHRLHAEGIMREPFQIKKQESSKVTNLERRVLINTPLLSQFDIKDLTEKREWLSYELRRQFRLMTQEATEGEYPFQTHGQEYIHAHNKKRMAIAIERTIFPVVKNDGQKHYRAINSMGIKGTEKEDSDEIMIFIADIRAGQDMILCYNLRWNRYGKSTEQKTRGRKAMPLRELIAQVYPIKDLFTTRGSSKKEKQGDLNVLWQDPAAGIDAVIDLAKECIPYWNEFTRT